MTLGGQVTAEWAETLIEVSGCGKVGLRHFSQSLPGQQQQQQQGAGAATPSDASLQSLLQEGQCAGLSQGAAGDTNDCKSLMSLPLRFYASSPHDVE